MRAFARTNVRVPALGSVTLVSLFSLACVNSSPTSMMLAPSPIIIPAAATVSVGGTQIFSVQNATVARFSLSADNQTWSECVSIDEAFVQANSIRLVARRVCRGLVYVVATIGDDRSPVVAVLKVE